VTQPYETHLPDVVKSVRQRWLLAHWTRLRRERPLPLWSEIDMAELESCFDDLSILEVLIIDGALRFRIQDHGKNVGAMYRGQCAGKFLEETLPPAKTAMTLETYEHAVRSRLPVYTVSRVRDRENKPVLYERLLLPVSDSGERVFRIIAFLETISIDGAFERRDLMVEPKDSDGYTLKAVLRPRVAAHV
jgi:hypothetical protein